jgi:hypothetical protein
MFYVINPDGTVAQKTLERPSPAFRKKVTVVEWDRDEDITQVVWDGSSFVPRVREEKQTTTSASQVRQDLQDAISRIQDPAVRRAFELLLTSLGR